MTWSTSCSLAFSRVSSHLPYPIVTRIGCKGCNKQLWVVVGKMLVCSTSMRCNKLRVRALCSTT
jgi:hypothetical protein